MSTYLVTGGAGFIGSNLAAALLEQGHTVRVLDNFSTGKRANLAALQGGVEVIEGDVSVEADARRSVRGVEAVFHMAAIPSVPRSVDDPLDSNRASVDGTLHILLAARDAGVRRVVFASSSAIYGDQDQTRAKSEDMTPAPISPYGVAKLAAEHYCQVFYRVYGLETVALRYFNVFGPRQDPASQYAAVIPRFITALLVGQPPTVYGDGEQTRDFTPIANVVHGNLLAVSAPADQVAGQVFNLAAGGQTSLNSLIDMLHTIVGVTIAPVYEAERAGDIKHSHADIRKAQRHMGYTATTSLLDGLRLTVEWYRSQRS